MLREEQVIAAVSVGANYNYFAFGALGPTGSIELHEHIGDDIFGHHALAHFVALQADVEWHIQEPELHVGIAELLRLVENRLALFGVEIGIVYDDIGAVFHELIQAFEEECEDFLFVALLGGIAVELFSNGIGIDVFESFVGYLSSQCRFAGARHANHQNQFFHRI